MASANNTVRAITNVTIPEEDAATASDTLTKDGAKENITQATDVYPNTTTNSTKKEQMDAIKAGASIPEPSNVTVPILKNDTEGAALKEKKKEEPCPYNQPKPEEK